MFYIDSTFQNARALTVADLDSLGGDFQNFRSLRDEWDFLVTDNDDGLVRI